MMTNTTASVYAHNPYATYDSYSAANTVPALWCCCCNERTTSAAEQFCSRRCSWTASCKCPQCGRKRAGGSIYCGMGCAREASHANWCPQCGVRQLASSNSHCTSCGYVPPTVRAAAKGEAHRILDPTEKEHKTLMKQWGGQSQGRTVIAIIRLAQTSAHRKSYLSYRAHVDVEVQTSGCPKYLHGGEGNVLRRFYPTTYACEFGLSGFASCMDPCCSVCSVASCGPSGGASLGYSSVDRALEASNANVYGAKAVFVCRVVCGSAYHAPYHGTETLPAGHHSTVITYPTSPARLSSHSKHHPSAFFPNAVDDAVVVERQDAVDPVFLILCA